MFESLYFIPPQGGDKNTKSAYGNKFLDFLIEFFNKFSLNFYQISFIRSFTFNKSPVFKKSDFINSILSLHLYTWQLFLQISNLF